jgi:preprotein translocase subunit SecG
LIGVVLLQKSEGGGLGVGGGGGGMSGLMTGRSTANLLTRTTAIIAAAFLATSLVLAIFAAHRERPRSILELPTSGSTAPAPAPAGQAPTGQPATGAPATGQPPAAPAPATGGTTTAPAGGAAPAGSATPPATPAPAPAQPQVPVGQ